MKIVYKTFICLFLTIFIACSGSGIAEQKSTTNSPNMKNEIERTLSKKYVEDFQVLEYSFDKGLNIYLFTAHPTENDKIVFEGKFDEREEKVKDKIDIDGYVNEKFSYEAGIFFASLFPNKEIPMYTSSSVTSYYDHAFGTIVPSWDEYLENRNEKSLIRMNCYFFEIPDHTYHQLVITTQAILELLQEKYKNDYSLYVGFWPSGFLEDKKLEELSFGFESTSMEDADNLLNVIQYLSKVLFIKIVNGSIDEIDDEKIFELIKDHNKNGPDEMVKI